jgi:phosphoadenosine phosphosulfate reductase
MSIGQIKKDMIETTKGYSALELLKYVMERFQDRIAFASSFGAEDQVVVDMLVKLVNRPKVFTLDTGRLPQETYDVIEQTRRKYGIEIEMLFPDYQKVEEMTGLYGPNLFYESVERRKLCCGVRKIEPLKRKLSELDAWICGLRQEQSTTRVELERVEEDKNFGIIKVSPIADLSTEQVWEYIKTNDVPYNKLHDQGYPSIGCACCTRAIESGEDIRSGRWWWEEPEHKECGLHLKPKQ